MKKERCVVPSKSMMKVPTAWRTANMRAIGVPKQNKKIYSSTFLFSHTNFFFEIWTFGPFFWQNAQPAHPRHVTVWSQNREIFFLSPLLMK